MRENKSVTFDNDMDISFETSDRYVDMLCGLLECVEINPSNVKEILHTGIANTDMKQYDVSDPESISDMTLRILTKGLASKENRDSLDKINALYDEEANNGLEDASHNSEDDFDLPVVSNVRALPVQMRQDSPVCWECIATAFATINVTSPKKVTKAHLKLVKPSELRALAKEIQNIIPDFSERFVLQDGKLKHGKHSASKADYIDGFYRLLSATVS